MNSRIKKKKKCATKVLFHICSIHSTCSCISSSYSQIHFDHERQDWFRICYGPSQTVSLLLDSSLARKLSRQDHNPRQVNHRSNLPQPADTIDHSLLVIWLQIPATKYIDALYSLDNYGSNPVNGVFIATDTQEHRIRIDRLQTPLGTYDKVVLRGSDIDAIEFSL